MSDEWDFWRRRRRFFEDPFRYFDELFNEMMEELDRMLREFERYPIDIRELEKRGAKVYGPYVYGFRITIGPDGRPVVEEFGNVKRVRGRSVITEEREPLVDVFESDDEITVVCEMPGVDKDKINVEVGEDRKTLIIRASDTDRKYYKEVKLSSEVDPESAKASYKNGILEVKLKKLKTERKGFKVKVE
ncbi:archaeal heat shock protein Hsp20 [Thermogladius sp. 4427co]|uniref:archaeal heat shock protein Hsp20 n=1 Tax=Thermogladius sp. 4427co TaxID=3450718 RepID=UPI003F78FBB5